MRRSIPRPGLSDGRGEGLPGPNPGAPRDSPAFSGRSDRVVCHHPARLPVPGEHHVGRRPTAGARLLHAPSAVMNGLVAGRTLPGENRPTADNDEIRSPRRVAGVGGAVPLEANRHAGADGPQARRRYPGLPRHQDDEWAGGGHQQQAAGHRTAGVRLSLPRRAHLDAVPVLRRHRTGTASTHCYLRRLGKSTMKPSPTDAPIRHLPAEPARVRPCHRSRRLRARAPNWSSSTGNAGREGAPDTPGTPPASTSRRTACGGCSAQGSTYGCPHRVGGGPRGAPRGGARIQYSGIGCCNRAGVDAPAAPARARSERGSVNSTQLLAEPRSLGRRTRRHRRQVAERLPVAPVSRPALLTRPRGSSRPPARPRTGLARQLPQTLGLRDASGPHAARAKPVSVPTTQRARLLRPGRAAAAGPPGHPAACLHRQPGWPPVFLAAGSGREPWRATLTSCWDTRVSTDSPLRADWGNCEQRGSDAT